MSTLAILKRMQSILKKNIKIKFKSPRKGDPAFIVADTKNFKSLFKNFLFKKIDFILKDYFKLYQYLRRKNKKNQL